MTVNISYFAGAGWQFFDNSGNTLSGGKLYTYLAGTTTPATTYTDNTGTVTSSNPIIMNAAGRIANEIWLDANTIYKFVLTDSNDILIATYDNIPAVLSPAELNSFKAALASSSGSSLVGFIATGTGATARTVQSKLRDTVSVKDYGVTGDGITDDRAKIQAAIDANPGRIILFPEGTYKITDTIFVRTNGTILMGEGAQLGGTVINHTNATTNAVVFTDGANNSGIESFYFYTNVKKASGYAVVFTGNVYDCFARDCIVYYYFNAFGIVGASYITLEDCQCGYLLGSRGIDFRGISTAPSFRMYVNNFFADNPYPGAVAPSNIKTWTATTAYSLNDVVVTNGVIWQCVGSGTSGGGGPSGYPGSTAQDVFSVPAIDGTVSWRFVCVSSLYWVVQDSYAYYMTLDNVSLVHGYIGVAIINNVNLAGSIPIWMNCWALETAQAFFAGVWCNDGRGLQINGSWIGGTLSGSGVNIATAYNGEAFIGSGTHITQNAYHGVYVQNGPTGITIDGCFIGYNGPLGAGVYHGIIFEANTSNFVVTNNTIGGFAGVPLANNQGYGIVVSNGTSVNYVINGNLLVGNLTGAMLDGGTGSVKTVTNNTGYNPSVQTPLSVTASPFTFTNNFGTPVQIFITGGTITSITVDGYPVVLAATNVCVTLLQRSTMVLTYTVIPTSASYKFQ
jgi:hypothetical protein